MLGTLMRGWAGIVESATLLAIVILAFGVMVRAVKLGNAVKYFEAIVGVVILLIMLPEIIIAIWRSMSALEHLGVIVVSILICYALNAIRGMPSRKRR